MSGMYIRGEVPDSCRNCPIVNKTKSGLRCPIASRRKGFSCTVSFGVVGRPSYCPIVPVPDHGRLGDLDALKKNAYPFPCAIGTEWAVTLRQINDAPTVIPSDYQEEV